MTVHTRAEAERKVRDGDVLAAIIVPADLIKRLQSTIALSGRGPKPTVEVLYNAEDPVKQQFVRVDDRLARGRPQQGGRGQADARSPAATSSSCCRAASSPSWASDFDIIGLKRSKALIDSVADAHAERLARPRGARSASRRFAQLAIDNLDLSDTVLELARARR